MEKELKIKLIESMAKTDEGQAIRETLEDFIKDIVDVSNIKSEILNGEPNRLVSEVVGRQIATQYIRVLTKTLKPLFSKEVKKKIIR